MSNTNILMEIFLLLNSIQSIIAPSLTSKDDTYMIYHLIALLYLLNYSAMEQQSYLGTDIQPDQIPTSDEKTLALLCHILTFIAPILAPLIIWLIKKDESAFIAYHAKESLNFQITVVIVCLILVISIIGLVVVWLVGIFSLILVILASLKASEGKLYKYPFTIRLVK